MKKLLIAAVLFLASFQLFAQPEIKSQWEGKRVAYLGDSITDARQIGTTNDVFWHMLENILGTRSYVYGISGHRMNQIVGQGERLMKDHGQDVDAIIVFIGTNDFNGNVPMGEWFDYSYDIVNRNGVDTAVRCRTMNMDGATFKGRSNITMQWLKTNYPDKQIILLTPIHRGFARFSDKNVQPPEDHANALGLFIDDYVQAVKEIANVWAVPVIDLNSISGLYPLVDEQAPYFRNAETDRLHPNTPGHVRMAYSIAYQLLAYPASFPALK